jgi:hypothetical protein
MLKRIRITDSRRKGGRAKGIGLTKSVFRLIQEEHRLREEEENRRAQDEIRLRNIVADKIREEERI